MVLLMMVAFSIAQREPCNRKQSLTYSAIYSRCQSPCLESGPRLGGAAALYPAVGVPRAERVRFPLSPLMASTFRRAKESCARPCGHLLPACLRSTFTDRLFLIGKTNLHDVALALFWRPAMILAKSTCGPALTKTPSSSPRTFWGSGTPTTPAA